MNYEIEPFECPDSPRQEASFCSMVLWHKRYDLPHEDGNIKEPEDFEEVMTRYREEDGEEPFVLPVYMYDHSGVTINTTGFSCPWDSGQVGWIFARWPWVRNEFGEDVSFLDVRTRAYEVLKAEVEMYDMFLTGDVWEIVVYNDDGEPVDSMCDVWGHEYAELEAERMLERCEKEAALERDLDEHARVTAVIAQNIGA